MSSSAQPEMKKYDVFLSFRGADTRLNFAGHLHSALTRVCIDVFMDDDDGEGEGERCTETLLNKISDCAASVVVFSKNYADSSWCLDQLVKVVECNEKLGQKLLPVFLGVEPAHVRWQTGAFGDGFRRLVQCPQFKDKEDTWRRALVEAAGLSGWDSREKSQDIIVQEIVDRIEKILDQVSLHDVSDAYVGISRVEKVELLLGVGLSDSVRSIGIWGMAGIGKTTIARLVFSRLSNVFDGACFVGNVREKSEKVGPEDVKKDMFLQLLGVESAKVGVPSMLSPAARMRLQRKRLLIVLDDVDNTRQLKTLLGRHVFYGPGSRIIVTSRDKQTLKNGCTELYEVEKLNRREALQLFKLHAFRDDQPRPRRAELLNTAVVYAQGLPLALEVLGRNLYGREMKDWEAELAKLEKIPDIEIADILRSSYDGLDQKEKNIFLDIACLFQGWIKDRVETILDACGFYAGIGLSRLIDKALVKVSKGSLWMHDLLQQVGQDIVLHECIEEPGKCSRLWRWKDINDVLARNAGTEKTEILSLDLSKAASMNLKQNTFKKMPRLRVLNFSGAVTNKDPYSSDIKVFLPDGLSYLPNELRFFQWDQYPLSYLPQKFQADYLVELNMRGSCLEELVSGEAEPSFPNLKAINLSDSKNLTRLPNFSRILKLESLDISNCKNLKEVPTSIGNLIELKSFTSLDNTSLETIPECSHLTKLESLSISGCSRIRKLPKIPPNLKFLGLSGTAIEELPSSSGCLSKLHTLHLRDCEKLEFLPSGITDSASLQDLDLSGCSKLSLLPENMGSLGSLEVFYLGGTAISSLPDSICNVRSLHTLEVPHCKNLKELPDNLGDMESLSNFMTDGCPLERLPPSITHLSLLENMSCEGYKGLSLPISFFGGLVSLYELNFRRSCLKSLPESIKSLPNLRRLYLSDCKNLRFLPELPSSLRRLDANNCSSLEHTHGLFSESDTVAPNSEDFELELVNCLYLTGDAREKIIAEFLQKIERMATHQPGQEYYMARARLCMPGNEVIELFEYTGLGSSLQLFHGNRRRRHDQLDSRCRLAFGVVVAAAPGCHPKKFGVKCKCLTESGKQLVSSCYYPAVYFSYVAFDEWDSILESEHVFVWYDCQEFETSAMLGNSKLEFCIVDYYDGQEMDGYVILKCGITPIGTGGGIKKLVSEEDGNSHMEAEELSFLETPKKRKHGIQED